MARGWPHQPSPSSTGNSTRAATRGHESGANPCRRRERLRSNWTALAILVYPRRGDVGPSCYPIRRQVEVNGVVRKVAPTLSYNYGVSTVHTCPEKTTVNYNADVEISLRLSL